MRQLGVINVVIRVLLNACVHVSVEGSEGGGKLGVFGILCCH